MAIPCCKECRGFQILDILWIRYKLLLHLVGPLRLQGNGAKDTHVCSHKSNTDIEDANNLILLTDSALCQQKGTEHRAHGSFLLHTPITSSTREGE